ncbi:DNA-directed RNA polymerase subunit D [Candidatus Woesearchaeota archaeon]|nr:DNA-directed RNA polymerase subunit D [Candidatus Woesearchaeota archaeon]
MIKLEKVKEEKKKSKLLFLIKGADEIFANTIRRLIVEEVPTLAVEDLEIKDNNSALYDEMLALRLGLIPIKTDLGSYTLKEKCKCVGAGCARCELKMTLKASKKGYVYAEEAKSTDPKCSFVQEKMPIVKLISKQKVDVQMTAILGQGKTHIKWSPGMAFYKHEPVLKVGSVKNPDLVVEQCTDGVFEQKGSKLIVVEEKVYDSNLLEHYAALDNGISLEHTDSILFFVESWGQLSCKEMLSTAGEILQEKVEEMEKLI